MAPMVDNGDRHWRQWMSPLVPMDVAIGANGDCDRHWRHSSNRHWRQLSIHWRHLLSPLAPMAPNDPFTKLNDTFTLCFPRHVHKGRPHPRGRGVSQKRTHADAGGRGVSGKKRTSSNLNFYQNFRSLNSVLCAKKQHLTHQRII